MLSPRRKYNEDDVVRIQLQPAALCPSDVIPLGRCWSPDCVHSVQVRSGLRAAAPREAVGDRASRHPVAEPHATNLGGMVRKTCALPPRLFGWWEKAALYRLDWIAITTV